MFSLTVFVVVAIFPVFPVQWVPSLSLQSVPLAGTQHRPERPSPILTPALGNVAGIGPGRGAGGRGRVSRPTERQLTTGLHQQLLHREIPDMSHTADGMDGRGCMVRGP